MTLEDELKRQVERRDKRISDLEQADAHKDEVIAMKDKIIDGLRLTVKDLMSKIKEK